ncbi:hypothetical protein DAETH_29020 [Deinococcus aetherius]|uniref:Uncharacterized protein n=1 Tax=Deinococcus aetherius TaxID=200252 RepID=A0ABM8AGJ5_9DEIO|nr:hypothetical protein [Deinococcus aetherius]BDP42933.1 hypothetical protein DAETH_29020 [Deinococcus aetherius]
MPNRLRLTGILTPPADDGWRNGVGFVRFDPADEEAARWAVPGYRPAWPIEGTPGILGNALVERNGGDLYVPGDDPGTTYAGPRMRVTYKLQTTAGDWYTSTFLWRAVSLGGGTVDLRTPPPEGQPPVVSRPGVPAGALLTSDLDNLVPSQTAFRGLLDSRGVPFGLATLDANGFQAQRRPVLYLPPFGQVARDLWGSPDQWKHETTDTLWLDDRGTTFRLSFSMRMLTATRAAPRHCYWSIEPTADTRIESGSAVADSIHQDGLVHLAGFNCGSYYPGAYVGVSVFSALPVRVFVDYRVVPR